jgi:hypothetical protein
MGRRSDALVGVEAILAVLDKQQVWHVAQYSHDKCVWH